MAEKYPRKAALVLILVAILQQPQHDRHGSLVVALSSKTSAHRPRPPIAGSMTSEQVRNSHCPKIIPHSKTLQMSRRANDARPAHGIVSRGRFLASMATIATMPILVKGEGAQAFETPGSLQKGVQPANVPSKAPELPSGMMSADTSTLTESVSGFVAGGALTLTKTVVKYPLDTATVRLQMPNSAFSLARPYQLFEDSFRGIATPLVSNIPAGAVFFAVKDATKQALKLYTGGAMPKWLSTSVAVAVAQAPYWAVRNPSEVVKTRQQAGVSGYGPDKTAIDAIKKIWEEESLDGLYSGFWENIFYAYPADVIKFVCYEALSGGKGKLSPAEGAVYGAVSTAAAQLVTTPLDVVRNRVMASSGSPGPNDGTGMPPNDAGEKQSYLGSIVKLATEEGLDGLFAGATPRVGKALLSGAIQFATYEETKASIAKWFVSK